MPKPTAAPPPNVPTVPGALPVIGHLGPLAYHPLEFLLAARRHGDIAKIHWGRLPVYLVSSAPLIHHMLLDKDDAYNRSGVLLDRLEDVTGPGLVAAHGKEHRRQKSLLNPAFHTNRLNTLTGLMREECDRVITAWKPGQVIDPEQEMFTIATLAASRYIFGAPVGKDFAHAFRPLLSHMFTEVALRARMPLKLENIPAITRRFANSRHRTDDLIGSEVRAFLKDPHRTRCVLSYMLQHNPRPDTGELIAQAATVLIGGTETAASTLAWLWHELAHHPAAEQRLHHEIDTVLGDTPIAADHFPQLPYTQLLIHETLRLHHPTWVNFRQTHAITELGTTTLPAGTTLAYSLPALYRDPTLYPKPRHFDPTRWESDQPQPQPPFFPFSAGSYKCIGHNYAQILLRTLITTIGFRWTLRHTPGHAVVKEKARLTVHPSKLRMTVTPRRATPNLTACAGT
ncbi:cytochrome P450 [Streptomyces spectabilis]|uniref:Cytochrome P450 n=1 Tax=Streptomyces spectabilis TaxID=68270 RepID=A0A7W8F013_STRST|nr:cytochrome P450 [Streptomyces spectabilis]MBB5109963.1 cytochrome P450 [Streptomyces spectabilis]GGV56708.1 cytochrome P450 [Streptomyces spectabilis]